MVLVLCASEKKGVNFEKSPAVSTRLLVVSNQAKNISALRASLHPNCTMVQYRYDTSALQGLLGMSASLLSSLKSFYQMFIGLIFREAVLLIIATVSVFYTFSMFNHSHYYFHSNHYGYL